MRVLGLDYGRKRIGLSISDENACLASPLPFYKRVYLRKDLYALATIAKEQHAGTLVIGLPLNMDGTKGKMAREVEAFARELQAVVKRPVELYDERLSSAEAERVLLEGHVKRQKRRQLRDGLAATVILQGFLDSRRKSE